MKIKTKIESTPNKTVRINDTALKVKKRGLVGIWKGKIKINGDIDNVFNLAL